MCVCVWSHILWTYNPPHPPQYFECWDYSCVPGNTFPDFSSFCICVGKTDKGCCLTKWHFLLVCCELSTCSTTIQAVTGLTSRGQPVHLKWLLGTMSSLGHSPNTRLCAAMRSLPRKILPEWFWHVQGIGPNSHALHKAINVLKLWFSKVEWLQMHS